jgi:hypothetical protein
MTNEEMTEALIAKTTAKIEALDDDGVVNTMANSLFTLLDPDLSRDRMAELIGDPVTLDTTDTEIMIWTAQMTGRIALIEYGRRRKEKGNAQS